MWIRVWLCEHGHVAKHTLKVPSVHRSADRVITGTAGGWAEHTGSTRPSCGWPWRC